MINEKTIWLALSEVLDPELPISIVDMGLIYDVRVKENQVEVDMTFTAIACPAMEMLTSDVREKIESIPGISSCNVNVIWNPPWTKARMTEQGKELMESIGVAV